jgi:hypothetical protein
VVVSVRLSARLNVAPPSALAHDTLDPVPIFACNVAAIRNPF